MSEININENIFHTFHFTIKSSISSIIAFSNILFTIWTFSIRLFIAGFYNVPMEFIFDTQTEALVLCLIDVSSDCQAFSTEIAESMCVYAVGRAISF